MVVVTTTSRQFLLAHTGFQYASESSTRWRCLCGSVYAMQPLATWLTSVCRPIPCMVASNCVPRRLELCWSRAPGLLSVSAASPSVAHEHGTVCQPADLRTPDTIGKFDRGLSQLLHDDLHWLDVPQRVQYTSWR